MTIDEIAYTGPGWMSDYRLDQLYSWSRVTTKLISLRKKRKRQRS
ncbi:MAG: hypothetical protein ACLUD2_11240 [Clostridium sp.]